MSLNAAVSGCGRKQLSGRGAGGREAGWIVDRRCITEICLSVEQYFATHASLRCSGAAANFHLGAIAQGVLGTQWGTLAKTR